jgi:ParB family chromosome partitioning protein
MVQKHGLGRGLSSLIPQKSKTQTPITSRSEYDIEHNRASRDHVVQNFDRSQDGEARDMVEEVAIGMVRANAQQPRMYFDEEKLDELSTSIKTHGILQPLIVTKKGDHYELIAGERRLRASKKAGLVTVPVVIKKDDGLSDQKKLELALIENIQRDDLNVIEEAKSYMRLAEEFDLSQEEIAVRSGKSRSVVANRIRLLSLPIEVQKGLIAGVITEGHAKIILSITNPQKQLALYHMIVDQKLTVRQAEDKAHMTEHTKHRRREREKTPHARRLEDQLTRYFGTRVRVSESSNGGNIAISYFSEEELKNILSRLKLM